MARRTSADLTVGLFNPAELPRESPSKNGEANRLQDQDRPVHQWYRFVLSFPPHLVREYTSRFKLKSRSRVLDPFCGTGTTLVECKKLGIGSVGVEAHPMPYFASAVKVDWSPDPNGLLKHAQRVADRARGLLRREGISDAPIHIDRLPRNLQLRTLPVENFELLLSGSISPLPLHKTLILIESLHELREEEYFAHERLALASALVSTIGNLHFGPEVGVASPKHDVSVIDTWLAKVHMMVKDLALIRNCAHTRAIVHHGDSRKIAEVVGQASVDAVFTSPPYPNEKDYTRTTRLESVLLGFVKTKDELRMLKQALVRSNTRTVFKDDDDDRWIANHPEIQRISNSIEARRLELGKTSGFERLYSKVAKLYFGGMARHLANLRLVLRPGAWLAYVVGDQASYLRVMIRTGQLLSEIASSLGYEVAGVDLFRTRLATATREQLREEVVVLRWPG